MRTVLGVRVKSGWAATVLLAGPAARPRLLACGRVALADPRRPATAQPWHASFEPYRAPGRRALAARVRAVERHAARALAQLLAGLPRGHRRPTLAIVAGSLTDPATIANEHIRAHAEEGRLFRRVVEQAARRRRLPARAWVERDLRASSARAARRPPAALATTLGGLRRAARTLAPGAPWRGEERVAALAALMTLAGAKPAGRAARGTPARRAARR